MSDLRILLQKSGLTEEVGQMNKEAERVGPRRCLLSILEINLCLT